MGEGRRIVWPMSRLPLPKILLPHVVAGLALAGAAWGASAVAAAASPAESAQALRAAHRQMSEQLANSSFGRPVQLSSTETAHGLQGDIYAIVDYPLAQVSTALKGADRWCELLLLHINNRRCRVAKAVQGGEETLTLSVVRRYDKPVAQAFELPFVYRVLDASPELLTVDLSAASGPLGTSNYHVVLEAVALGERKTFLHFGYSYDHNMMARLATQAYLATFGRDKVGFTVLGKGSSNGEPDYIRGTRGLVERNAMRYFLTLDAYLAELGTPPPEQTERRWRRWYSMAEQYPRQLHEIDLQSYLALKREDQQREDR